MADLASSCLLILLFIAGAIAYFVRSMSRGRVRNERVEKESGSSLGRPLMEGAYWMFDPVVSLLAGLGVTPNAVTAFSLLPMILAAVAVATGHFGIAGLGATVAGLCDMLDGILARRLGVASDAGEVFDASVDRYSEFLLVAGLAVLWRSHMILLITALAVVLGSFMVSYATAKAEALGVKPPKGAMRRAERAFYVNLGCVLVPLWRLVPLSTASVVLDQLPIVVAAATVGIGANVAAARRLYRVAQLVRAQNAATAPGST